MTTLRIGILYLALFGLSGCASMSGEECALSDWHTIGFEDGSQGHAADRLGDHRRACARHGIAPDFEAYRTGRDEGLRLFCQPSRGFNLGASGGRYNGVCSADLEPAFLDRYRSGSVLYSLRAAVDSATYQIHARENELERTEDLIREKEATLIDGETTTEQRIQLLADLKDLSERTGQLEAEIDLLIDDRARHQERLASYQATLAYDIGLGVSAISRIGDSFSQNPRDLPGWEAALDSGRLPVWRGIELSPDDLLRSDVIQQLMCHGRIDVAGTENRHDIDFGAYFADSLASLEPLGADGLVSVSANEIVATSRGRLLMRIIAMCFDRYLQESQPARYSRTI